MSWPTKAKKRKQKLKTALKLAILLIIGICVISGVSNALDEDFNSKDKVEELKEDLPKLSEDFDISIDKDCQGDIREIKIKV